VVICLAEHVVYPASMVMRQSKPLINTLDWHLANTLSTLHQHLSWHFTFLTPSTSESVNWQCIVIRKSSSTFLNTTYWVGSHSTIYWPTAVQVLGCQSRALIKGNDRYLTVDTTIDPYVLSKNIKGARSRYSR